MNKVEKLWNLGQLRKFWWSCVRHQCKTLIPGLMVAMLINAWLIPAFIKGVVGGVFAKLPWFEWFSGLSFFQYYLLLLPFGVLFSIPLILACVGKYPTQKCVENNQRLRRAMGLSDEISKETTLGR